MRIKKQKRIKTSIKVVDNFDQVGKMGFTKLAMNAYEIYLINQANPSIDKHLLN